MSIKGCDEMVKRLAYCKYAAAWLNMPGVVARLTLLPGAACLACNLSAAEGAATRAACLACSLSVGMGAGGQAACLGSLLAAVSVA